jgi:hypothetical protein
VTTEVCIPGGESNIGNRGTDKVQTGTCLLKVELNHQESTLAPWYSQVSGSKELALEGKL